MDTPIRHDQEAPLKGVRNGKKLGKEQVIGRQTSERGGIVECLVDGDDSTVTIIGVAVQTMTGNLLL